MILKVNFQKKANLKSFTVVILSSHNQEYTYKYCSKSTMENSLFKLKDKFKTMNHIKMKNSNSTLLYELSDAYNFFDKNTYEICLIVNSKFEFESHLTGILYLSTQINSKKILLKEINNPKILSIIEMTFYLIQSKIDLYDKLYYTIDLFLEFLSVKKKYLLFHINNVTSWCLKLAKKLELSSKDTLILYVSALMYDLGNIYIPNNILNKNSKLTLHEYEVVKSHPIKSYDIAKAELIGLEFFKDVPNIVIAHHERFSGEGYPYGLKGYKTPYLARILSVADSVYSMLSTRNYREQKNISSVIAELKKVVILILILK